mmetsp:Transcript_17005/g.29076  ORF Transcript_17005/g.29076 Transcript_17005/m.29076 type:complete len:337 (-) Transcript_17005:1004-2014(-)
MIQVGHGAGDPFVHHKQAQVAKQGVEKNHLWKVFTPVGQPVLEKIVVEEAHEDAQVHVGHAHQDAHLHLHAVEVWQLSPGAFPAGIHPEGVGPSLMGKPNLAALDPAVPQICDATDLSAHITLESGATTEGHGHGEELVVDRPREDREQCHQQNAVPARECHAGHVIQFRFQESFLVPQEEQREHEHQYAVADVPKHDRKEEGKGHNGEHRWIDLTVASHTIGRHDALKTLCELVSLEVGGRLLVVHAEGLHHSAHVRVGTASGCCSEDLSHLNACSTGDPSLCHKHLAGSVHAHLVESVIHTLLVPGYRDPLIQIFCHKAQHAHTVHVPRCQGGA